jgi:murein DD-endopeptidase MepM/ murein hydrolase activator NlpD
MKHARRPGFRAIAGAIAGLCLWVTGVAAVSAQQSAPLHVRWTPERPVKGTLFRLHFTPAEGENIAQLRANFAGEPLHVTAHTNGALSAFAAIPIDAADSLTLEVTLVRDDSTTGQMRVSIPAARGQYRLELLRVAPRFGTPPDSATQARIMREQDRGRAVGIQSHSTPSLWDSDSVMPPRTSRITSGFGHGRQYNGQIQSRHMGTDYAGAMGSPVRAAARGVIALADTFYLAGQVIYIDHGAGLVSAYFHLSRTDVVPGDTVQPGQIVGRVGASGRVTGPHLHWTVRYGTITVDPLSLLALANRTVSDTTGR